MSRILDARMCIALPSALAMLFNIAWAADTPPQELLDKYGCTICHSESDAAAGPAWVDIAMHYRGNRQANRLVADKIRSGAHGSGPWHMPPNSEISEAEATAMARYILAVKD